MLRHPARTVALVFLFACSSEREPSPCGDGVLQPGELCDPAIAAGPGACPNDCDDGDPCTADEISGSACRVECRHPAITTYVGGDACCPPGADSTTDPDCSSSCGNAIVERGELCDPGIASGAGRCPSTADCNDNLACTRDEVVIANGDPCQAACANTEITTAGPADACCPSGAAPGSDPDCAGCGDGVVGGSETCDTAITSGPNRCPTAADCNDGDACTVDSIVGEGSCNAACMHAPNTALVSGDGCCLTAGTFPTLDADCPQLGLGYSCNNPLDCQSNRCEFFETANGSYCTTSCAPETAEHEGGCPSGADGSWERVCLSAAEASNGGAQNVCAYFQPGPAGFAELQPNVGYMWSFVDPSQVHIWMIPSFADNTARTWRIAITPTAAGLDVAGRRLDPALLPTGAVCNSAGPGGAESCTLAIAATEASERFWFALWPQAGLGDYQIMMTQE